ncbi:mitotic apparatus protein p62 [Botrytis cinerea]
MAAKQLPAVLRITSSATNQDEGFLLHVESAGSRPLDLKLVGTDGELVFAVSENENVTRGVEIHAKVEKKAVTLVIQKVIEGIKQRLGAIKLDETEEEEIGLFEWCALATRAAESAKDELETLRTKYREQQKMLDGFNETFREVNKTKSDYEIQLLEKFSLLQNEKKLKIRDQQTLLASAKVDPENSIQTAGASRTGKRKAGKEVQAESSDSDDAFEKMDIDKKQQEDDTADESDQQKIQTPDRSDEETEDEADASQSKPQRRKGTNIVQDDSDEEMQTAPKPTETTKIAELPAKRELPFAKKAAPVPAPKPADDGSETESGSDDEL